MKKEVAAILFLAFSLLNAGLISANLSASVSPLYANSSQNTLYNFTISNTAVGINLTQINITVPSGFAIVTTGTSGYGGSWGGGISVEEGFHAVSLSNLSTGGLLFGGSSGYYYFTAANANSTGSFNFTLASLDTSSNTNVTNVSVSLQDVTSPAATFISPTPANSSVLTGNYFPVNISALDNVGIDNVSIILYGSSGNIVKSSNLNSPPFFVNFTNLTYGNYSFQATAFDSSGNSGVSLSRYLTLKAAAICTENWTCAAWGACSNSTKTKNCLSFVDSNSCNTTLQKPVSLTQPCTPDCANWVCDDWIPNPCTGNQTQIMICKDSNGCEEPKNYTRACPQVSAAPSNSQNQSSQSGNSSISTAFIVVMVLVLASIISVVVIMFRLRRKADYTSGDSDFGNNDELGRPKAY